MLREFFRLTPRIENVDLNRMERSLNRRFARVARRFGRGMMTALRGGGAVGMAIGALNRILNPLQATQEAIDKLLNQGNDLVTNAQQFNTTAGKLFKLQTFAQATGLEDTQLFDMMRRFQRAVAEAEARPNQASSVRAFVGSNDMAEAFFEFVQSLNKLDRNQQVLVQREVFGERATLRMADFLRADFEKLGQRLGLRGSEQYTGRFERASGLAELDRELRARREAESAFSQAGELSEAVIRQRDIEARKQEDQNRKRIQSYEDLNTIQERMNTVIRQMENLLTMAGRAISRLDDLTNKITDSRIIRGIFDSWYSRRGRGG